MIETGEAAQRLVSAAASIGPAWERHRDLFGDEPAGAYNDVAVVAQHVVDLMTQGRHEEIRSVLDEVEDLLSHELSVSARGVVVLGFIEGVQNITSHRDVGVPSSSLVQFLGPATREAWDELHVAWGTRDT